MKKTVTLLLSLIFCIGFLSKTLAQEIPVHISSVGMYDFLDELANDKIIVINSAIKPFSRKKISEWLLKADSSRTSLSLRQQKELDRYLLEITGQNPQKPSSKPTKWQWLSPEFRYQTKNASFVIRPLYEIKYWMYGSGTPFYQSVGGAEILFHKGIVSGYGSLTDRYEHKEILKKPNYLISTQGGNYKIEHGGRLGGDFSEMRGGLFLNWKWGRAGICKDHIQWGDNQFGGLIFSGQNPSYPMISLHMEPFRWFDFDYIHGWLVSETIDSSSSYFSSPNVYRGIFQPKYIAANMYSFRPWKHLNISLGNSIIYSDMPVQLAYLIPFLFYKSVDHTLNHNIDNQNSQIFLNISSRNLKHLHVYGNLFIDEFSIKRIRNKEEYNFFGFKIGGTLSNWPLKNMAFDAEQTTIFPMVYKHRVSSLTFASNKYNLGYYMGANSMDFNFRIRFHPFVFLKASLQYTYSIHGNEYEYILNNDLVRHALIEDKTWDRHVIAAKIKYIPWTGFEVYSEANYSVMKGYAADGKTSQYYLDFYSPKVFHGKNFYLIFGFKIGI